MIVRPLKGVRAVREAFAGPLRVRSGPVAAIGIEGPSTDGLAYVVVVAKSRVRRAVDRNRVKRLLREALRQAVQQRPLHVPLVTSTVVVRWQADVSPSLMLHHIVPHVQAVLAKLSGTAPLADRHRDPS